MFRKKTGISFHELKEKVKGHFKNRKKEEELQRSPPR